MEYPTYLNYKRDGTSAEAAAHVHPSCEEARRIICLLLAKHGDMSRDEVATKMGWTVLFTRPRFTELIKDKLIQVCGRTKNVSGRTAETYCLVRAK